MVRSRNWQNELDEDNNEVKPYTDKIETENIMDEPESHLIKYENGPTQTHGLLTTVPQNIANLKIGDKHTPTRNSLRHSRMVVMIKSTKGSGKQSFRWFFWHINTIFLVLPAVKKNVPIENLPPIVIYHDRAKAVMWIILIVGIIMSFECSSLQIYAPNTKSHLNPFYTAIPILFSGIFGFVHVKCCRKEYPGLQRNLCEKFIKIFSITTSFVAIVTGIIYFFNIMIHLISFLNLNCVPPDALTETCICRVEDEDMLPSFFNNNWDYIDLSCFELYNIFNVILGFTAFTCLIIAFLESYYLNLHWANHPMKKNNQDKTYSFI